MVAWAFDRAGRRPVLHLHRGHLHASLAQEGYRRLIVNGILWSAGLDVPKGGARVDLDAAELPKYLKPPPKK